MTGIDLSGLQRVDTTRIGEVAGIFGRHQAGQARSLQRSIGPSEVGHPCDRHLAYKLAGVPHAVTEPLKWAALLGTWCHGGAEHAMHEENARIGRERYLIERRALINDAIVEGGNTDVFDLDFLEVIDWKFPGESSAEKAAKESPVEYVVQGMLYGLGWHRMGHTPKTVRIIFLPRWSNDINAGHELAFVWDEALALEALDRLAIIQGAANLAAGGLLPWANIEADKTKCRFCPWLQRKRPGQAEADGTGCHGYYQSNDWMGVDAAPATPLDGSLVRMEEARKIRKQLIGIIEDAESADELTAIWRNNRERWDDECTAAARKRKADLAGPESLPGL